MARRLTEQERENVETLTSQLIEALPPAQRSFSSGIASALVRMSGDTVTEDDLAHILEKYEEADETVAQVVRDMLLDAVDGQEGVYTLRLPEAEGEASADVTGAGPDANGNTGEAVPAEEAATNREPAAEAAPGDLSDEPAEAEDEAVPAEEEAAGDSRGPEGGEPEDAGASPESAPAVEEAQASKPRRSHRRARRTHKTAKVAQGEDSSNGGAAAQSKGAQSGEGEAQAGSSQQEEAGTAAQDVPATQGEAKPGDVRPGRGSRSRGARAEKPSKSQAAKPQSGQTQDGKGKGPKESRSDADKGSEKAEGKPAADKQTANDDKPSAGKPSAGKPDKGHRKDSSRDLKKVPYVRRGGETEAEVRQKILNLDQRFWLNGWLLSHPAAYTLYERELVAINDALKDGMLPGDITRRQLAYQMGGDEKFFEYGSDGFRLLRAMGMEDVIRHRPMPKPDLVYYAPRRRKHMTVLVTENLDPYLDVHDLMYEDGRTSILGQRIHAVVLGGGTPILEKNRLALLLDTLGADTVSVLYWGDIDRAGLEIMVKLKEVLGDGYKFRAFTPAYQLMVDRASERFPDPADNESTGQVNIEPMDASLLVDGLTDEAAAYARAVIDDCGLIPQEILTRRDL